MDRLPFVVIMLAALLLRSVQPAPARSAGGAGTSPSPVAGSQTTPTAAPLRITVPSVADGVDSLDLCVDGKTLHVLIGSNDGRGSAVFRHSKSSDGGATWSDPIIVSTGGAEPVPHHRGADARIIARGNRLFAAWTTPGTGFKGTGPMGTALSTDGGKTWKPGPNPADHDSTGSHRFLALTAAGDTFHLVWLDDRNKLRGLRHASSADGGATWSSNATIDEFTCACCWNMMLFLPASPADVDKTGTLFTLYRDMKPSDMGIARSSDGGKSWLRLGHVGAFHWEFDGCPHVGGALAAAPSPLGKGDVRLFATVWSGKDETVGCHLLASDDRGNSFTVLRRIGGDTAKMTDIASDAAGAVAIAWDEVEGDDRAVFAMTSTDGGRTWSEPQRLSAAGMQASHPRVIANPAGGFAVFFTQSQGGKAAELVAKPVAAR